MDIQTFVPQTEVALPAATLSIARFENQRWVRARQSGLRGSNPALGAFVDITGGIALLFATAFLVAFAWEFGWQTALGLFIIAFMMMTLWSLIMRDNFAVWMIGTLAIWPLMFFLSKTVTWFGLL